VIVAHFRQEANPRPLFLPASPKQSFATRFASIVRCCLPSINRRSSSATARTRALHQRSASTECLPQSPLPPASGSSTAAKDKMMHTAQATAARRVGVLAGQLAGQHQQQHEGGSSDQLVRAACAAAASAPQRSKMFEGKVICITGAAKVRVGARSTQGRVNGVLRSPCLGHL